MSLVLIGLFSLSLTVNGQPTNPYTFPINGISVTAPYGAGQIETIMPTTFVPGTGTVPTGNTSRMNFKFVRQGEYYDAMTIIRNDIIPGIPSINLSINGTMSSSVLSALSLNIGSITSTGAFSTTSSISAGGAISSQSTLSGTGLTLSSLSGSGNRMVIANASGVLSTLPIPAGDNLGNHTATTTLNLSNQDISTVRAIFLQSNNTIDGSTSLGGIRITPRVGINTLPDNLYTLRILGNAFASSGSWLVSSDEKLKTDVKGKPYGLNDITKINSYSYKYKDDKTAMRKIGVMAQEVRKVFPELVFEGGDGTLGVDYLSFVPILIEALKEQQQRINALEEIILNKAGESQSSRLSTSVEHLVSELFDGYPNPSSAAVEIPTFVANGDGDAKLVLFDGSGNRIKEFTLRQGSNLTRIDFGSTSRARYCITPSSLPVRRLAQKDSLSISVVS